jgi:hypothetical protein
VAQFVKVDIVLVFLLVFFLDNMLAAAYNPPA